MLCNWQAGRRWLQADGTSRLTLGGTTWPPRPADAIGIIGVSSRSTSSPPGPAVYMQKLVVPA